MKSRFFKNDFLRNVSTLMVGTLIAQAIPIIISPIITRLYSPENFGVFAVYSSIVLLGSSLVAGKYELAILIPKRNEHAKDLVNLSSIISIIICLILFIIVVLFYESINNILGENGIGFWLYLVPFNILILSFVSILYLWNNRGKNYKLLSYNQTLRSTSQGVLNLTLANTLNGTFGLIFGTFFSSIISLYFLVKKSISSLSLYKFSPRRIMFLSKKYKSFPVFMLPSGILENLSSHLPIFLMGSFYGSGFVGFFALSQRVVKIPLGIIGSSIGNVFREEASKKLALNGECRILFVSTLKKLVILSLFPFLIFGFLAPDIFGLVFGLEWIEAGEYAQILSIVFFLQFITSPLSGMFIIAQKQKHDLYLQVFLLIGVFSSLLIGYKYFNSPTISLWFFTITYSVKYLLELILSYRFSLGLKKVTQNYNLNKKSNTND